MPPLVRIHLQPPSASVILQRPDKRNALSRELLAELQQAFGDLHLERRVKAVILTGAGTSFCAGMDLAEMQATRGQPDAYARWAEDTEAYLELLLAMLRFPKPIVAAVNGPALAGGAGLVLASDVALAADSARFGLPEAKRGLVAGVVAPLLAFRCGGGHAAYLMLTAREVDAAEAHRLGLFQEVVAGDKLWPRAVQVVEEIAHSAPEALLLSKRVLNETVGEQLLTLLVAGAAASATARTTEAAAEGLAAFLEKRPPQWP